MSAKEYREAFNHMTDEEHELMWDLFMSCENHDCHTWVTFGNVERVVGKIILGRVENERRDGI